MFPDPSNVRNILEIGGGGLRDVGSYAVSTARFMVGSEPTRVLGLMYRDPSLKTDTLTTGVLDFGKARSVFTVGTQTQAWQQVDVVGSGVGEHVLVLDEGNGARQVFGSADAPVRSVVVGIIDRVDLAT